MWCSIGYTVFGVLLTVAVVASATVRSEAEEVEADIFTGEVHLRYEPEESKTAAAPGIYGEDPPLSFDEMPVESSAVEEMVDRLNEAEVHKPVVSRRKRSASKLSDKDGGNADDMNNAWSDLEKAQRALAEGMAVVTFDETEEEPSKILGSRPEYELKVVKRPVRSTEQSSSWQARSRDLPDVEALEGLPHEHPHGPIQMMHPQQSNYLTDRMLGTLCGTFSSDILYAEIRALNSTQFSISDICFQNSFRSHYLKFTFLSSNRKRAIYHYPIHDFLVDQTHMGSYNVKMTPPEGRITHVMVEDQYPSFRLTMDISRCHVPTMMPLGPLENATPGVSTSQVVLASSNVAIIRDFAFNGNAPAAYFKAGFGEDLNKSFRLIPMNGRTDEPLGRINHKHLAYQLPHGLSWYHVDYLVLYCEAHNKIMGYKMISRDFWQKYLLPPPAVTNKLFKH